jgi:hypothetical protein
MIAASNPLAPVLVHRYATPRRALFIRASYVAGPSAWTESAGVRACDVFGFDAVPSSATRALIEYREGKGRRKVWVSISELASTPAIAAEKMAAHFSALLSAPGAASKMPVSIGASSGAEVSVS